ncbi:uncharacterized protein LOC120326021 [Styela clava]|uniref:delta-like protein B n=1 Tax=Styela clava TaxID=7725 RepID=UPI001939C701|nr:delta-like protein B [Styela clava]
MFETRVKMETQLSWKYIEGIHKTTVAIFACMLLLDTQVSASGVFEIRVDEFVNQAGRAKNGECCELSIVKDMEICSKPCRTSFHVCFTHFQSSLGSETKCTFGSAKTPVLGSNTISPTQSDPIGLNVIRLKFNFTWPKSFALVIEATHEHENDDSPPTGKLIARMQKKGDVDANQDWATEVQTQQEKILRYSYRVKCDQHYYGDGCSKYCRPRDDMFGHYTCDRNGEKVCLDGWRDGTGSYCSEPICLPGCNATHGDCKRPNECICRQGWEGELCDKCQTYPGCSHGTCQKIFECNCDPGWGGMLCNLDLNYCTNHKPCKNGARCTNSGQGSFSCECPPGFTGRECEIEMNDCEPNPCKNGAKCTVQKYGGYTCECPDNFFGPTCEKTHVTCATKPCKNGGTCFEELTQYRCRCEHGFRGLNCEIEDKRCSPKTCLNGGTCQNEKNGYTCSCRFGYSGKRCQNPPERCERNTCKNGGTCVNNRKGFECKCTDEFSGKRCEMESPCFHNPCQNNGRCMKIGGSEFSCLCRASYKGDMCETPIADGLSAGQYDSNKNTRIIVLTKDEKSGLNTAQWIAVCFGSGFLLLIFVAIAICVIYQRQIKSTYIGGRAITSNFSQSGNSESGNQNPESASDRSSVGLYTTSTSPTKTSFLTNDLSHEREMFSSEIVVVPTNTLSPARKCLVGSKSTEFLTKAPESYPQERREKRSSLILTAGHQNHKHQNHANSHYDVGCVKRGDDVSTNSRASTHTSETGTHASHRSRSLSRQRHGDNLRLPTYQEACREERFSSSQVV